MVSCIAGVANVIGNLFILTFQLITKHFHQVVSILVFQILKDTSWAQKVLTKQLAGNTFGHPAFF